MAKSRCKVYILNPGDLANIYRSLKKTDKEDALKKNRLDWISQLPERFKSPAERMNKSIEHAQVALKELQKEIHAILKKEPAYCALALSIPGSGPITTAAFYAFLGDCRRFSSAKQAAYYTGLVPRIDISGDCVRYGPITKRGAHLFRRPLIQVAWSLVRSPHGGDIKKFYERLYQRIGKKKAIAATARKITEVFYAIGGSFLYKVQSLSEALPKQPKHQ